MIFGFRSGTIRMAPHPSSHFAVLDNRFCPSVQPHARRAVAPRQPPQSTGKAKAGPGSSLRKVSTLSHGRHSRRHQQGPARTMIPIRCSSLNRSTNSDIRTSLPKALPNFNSRHVGIPLGRAVPFEQAAQQHRFVCAIVNWPSSEQRRTSRNKLCSVRILMSNGVKGHAPASRFCFATARHLSSNPCFFVGQGADQQLGLEGRFRRPTAPRLPRPCAPAFGAQEVSDQLLAPGRMTRSKVSSAPGSSAAAVPTLARQLRRLAPLTMASQPAPL